jgi:hypothetical protein
LAKDAQKWHDLATRVLVLSSEPLVAATSSALVSQDVVSEAC